MSWSDALVTSVFFICSSIVIIVFILGDDLIDLIREWMDR